ncbi:MAG: T9SS type A sorting domain-containing protein [Candidatus Marinimicrobia bacterium]|nr:T9SS type A sorting domain-containing protein [Candidatus Neomarinimicrobiota bacterium]
MKKSLLIGLTISMVFVFNLLPLSAQHIWQKYEGNPILEGTVGGWDEGIYSMDILQMGDTLKMWYTGHDGGASGLWLFCKIGYAWSLDGIEWHKRSDPVFDIGTENWYTVRIRHPKVLYDSANEQYQMWYFGDFAGTGYATSPDGIQWTPHPDNPVDAVTPAGGWDEDGLCLAGPVIYEDDLYKTWYMNRPIGGGIIDALIGYATSTDGITWDKHSEPVLVRGEPGSWYAGLHGVFTVLPNPDGYDMWYCACRDANELYRIGHATSTDGITWYRDDPVVPVLALGPGGSFDEQITMAPCVRPDPSGEDLLWMWYTGKQTQTHDFLCSIGYATSLIGFTGLSITSDPYVVPGVGLVTITALFDGDTTNLALFADVEDENANTLDSLQLFDDGLHSDGNANDGVYANSMTAPATESTYYVGLKAVHNGAVLIDYNDLDRFTTTDPPEIEDYYFYGTDTIPNHGDAGLKMKIILRNSSQSVSVTDITAILTAIDSNAFVRSESDPTYGDIATGESDTTAGFYRIRFYDVEPDTVYAYFKLDIASDGYFFWTADTFSIFVRREGVGVQDELSIPGKFTLHQNYPNPFNPVTIIQYELPQRSDVQITIFDLLGREVTILVSEEQDAGFKSITWDATNDKGQPVSAGMYFYQIRVHDPDAIGAGEFIDVKKCVLIK